MGPVAIETARLRLREWTADDIDDMLVLQSDPEVMRFLGPMPTDPAVLRAETEEWIGRQMRIQAGWGWCRWAVELREPPERILRGVVGFSGPGCGFPPDVEIGWTLRRELWGKDLATEAARAILDYCFSVIGFERVISCIDPGNAASLRVAAKMGFAPLDEVEHDGDTLIRHVLLNPLPDPPRDPRFRRDCIGAPQRPATTD